MLPPHPQLFKRLVPLELATQNLLISKHHELAHSHSEIPLPPISQTLPFRVFLWSPIHLEEMWEIV